MYQSITKTLVSLVILTFVSFPVWSCPFDEAGIEVTILAHDSISGFVKAGDFASASKKIESQKYLYEYFEQGSKTPLYQPLLDASNNEKGDKVIQLLDHSLVLEIGELLGQVDEMFNKYQKSRLRLIKAKKHLKALTAEKEPMDVMKTILKSIGNPGLMGVGLREPDKEQFSKNKNLLLSMIASPTLQKPL